MCSVVVSSSQKTLLGVGSEGNIDDNALLVYTVALAWDMRWLILVTVGCCLRWWETLPRHLLLLLLLLQLLTSIAPSYGVFEKKKVDRASVWSVWGIPVAGRETEVRAREAGKEPLFFWRRRKPETLFHSNCSPGSNSNYSVHI